VFLHTAISCHSNYNPCHSVYSPLIVFAISPTAKVAQQTKHGRQRSV